MRNSVYSLSDPRFQDPICNEMQSARRLFQIVPDVRSITTQDDEDEEVTKVEHLQGLQGTPDSRQTCGRFWRDRDGPKISPRCCAAGVVLKSLEKTSLRHFIRVSYAARRPRNGERLILVWSEWDGMGMCRMPTSVGKRKKSGRIFSQLAIFPFPFVQTRLGDVGHPVPQGLLVAERSAQHGRPWDGCMDDVVVDHPDDEDEDEN